MSSRCTSSNSELMVEAKSRFEPAGFTRGGGTLDARGMVLGRVCLISPDQLGRQLAAPGCHGDPDELESLQKQGCQPEGQVFLPQTPIKATPRDLTGTRRDLPLYQVHFAWLNVQHVHVRALHLLSRQLANLPCRPLSSLLLRLDALLTSSRVTAAPRLANYRR